ncbi:RNA-binding protein 14-like [Crotalus adamanteus]|uniref:RNA-binding protein 14-like n=1 Tax=Crotalus adamanteus TaxID=8729 RepID=A0AAW1B157_CROAD
MIKLNCSGTSEFKQTRTCNSGRKQTQTAAGGAQPSHDRPGQRRHGPRPVPPQRRRGCEADAQPPVWRFRGEVAAQPSPASDPTGRGGLASVARPLPHPLPRSLGASSPARSQEAEGLLPEGGRISLVGAILWVRVVWLLSFSPGLLGTGGPGAAGCGGVRGRRARGGASRVELRNLFEAAVPGVVVKVALMKQFTFIHLHDEAAAEHAIQKLNGHLLHCHRVVVEFSRPRPTHTVKTFVGNVSATCTSGELCVLFQEFGPVIECHIVKGVGGDKGRTMLLPTAHAAPTPHAAMEPGNRQRHPSRQNRAVGCRLRPSLPPSLCIPTTCHSQSEKATAAAKTTRLWGGGSPVANKPPGKPPLMDTCCRRPVKAAAASGTAEQRGRKPAKPVAIGKSAEQRGQLLPITKGRRRSPTAEERAGMSSRSREGLEDAGTVTPNLGN